MSGTRRMDSPQIAVFATQAMQTPERHPPLPRKYRSKAENAREHRVNGAPMVVDIMLTTCAYLHG